MKSFRVSRRYRPIAPSRVEQVARAPPLPAWRLRAGPVERACEVAQRALAELLLPQVAALGVEVVATWSSRVDSLESGLSRRTRDNGPFCPPYGQAH